MDKCIHPSCSCKGYKEPKGAKGTLLQLRTGCQQCSHQASLHRKLTSIDRYIQDEVKRAKKSTAQCTHLILTRDIPKSPLFEPYDLIPLPREDQCTSENHEGGVQCTCKGFEIDLVRLWQKFRTHNLDYVRMELPKAACSFCSHALSEHLASESASADSTPQQTENAHTASRKNHRPLALKASASISCSVALGKSAVLLLPTSMDRCKRMMAVLLHRVADTKELELCLVTRDFRTLEGVAEKMDMQPSSSSDQQNGEEAVVQSSGKGMEEDPVPLSDSKVVGESSMNGKKSTKRGTKRKLREDKSSVAPESNSKRRSLRIAEKKKKKEEEKTKFHTVDEQWLKKHRGKKSKIEAFLESKGYSEMEAEQDDVTVSLSDSEVQYLSGNAVGFVQSLSNDTSFRRCGKLPSNISSKSHIIVATHQIEVHCSQEEGEEEKKTDTSPSLTSTSSQQLLSVVLVAVASEDGSTVCTAPLRLDNTQTNLLWTPLDFLVSPSTKMTSLSWTESAEDSPYDVFLCAGSDVGGLYVCGLKLQRCPSFYTYESVQLVERIDSEQTKDQITACAWAPDKKSLVAGTICGEILVYSASLEAAAVSQSTMQPKSGSILKHMQTLQVSGGSVRCLAWSKDSRLLAVGGSDDNIQILQSREPKEPSTKPISSSSILNYFQIDDSKVKHKFVHTHTLRGHQSFIADVCFLGSGHRLVSIGWDSQLLLWNNLLLPSLPKTIPSLNSSSSRAVHHNTKHTEQSVLDALPHTEVEPAEGFKLGPSASVDFLPLTVCNYLDCGLFVLVRNRLGAVYVVLYMRSP